MQLTFDFDIDDYAAFQHHYKKTAPAFRRSFYLLLGTALFFLVVLIFNILGILLGRINSSNILYFLVWLILIGLWLWYSRSKKSAKRRIKALLKNEKDNSQVLGERTFLFENDYFSVKTIRSENKSDWSVIRKVDETPEYFFLYTSNFMAYVIPKCKIESQKQELQRILHQYIPQEKYKLYKK